MKTENSSYRDRDGFIFYHENEVYRSISPNYFEDYRTLIDSGLYDSLSNNGKLVRHIEVDNFTSTKENKIIKPTIIPFISYPYEWSFYQLKRAALLTLEIQMEALQKGMSLKDATAFNVQFLNCKPIFIDTLSFEKYKEKTPWQAYKQFCQHFLSPLCLQVYGVSDLNKLQIIHLDGIPLELTSKILPFKSKLNISIYSHIHLNAKYERKYKGERTIGEKKIDLPKSKLISILKHLTSIISDMSLPKSNTNWTEYYTNFSYTDKSIEEKKEFIESTLKQLKAEVVIDSGCNTGLFSEIASNHSTSVLSFDFDPSVIHNQCKLLARSKKTNILPLIVDFTNPTPAIGWGNKERKSFLERLPKDSTTLSLALIHHLVLSNNLTFEMIASLYSDFSKHLIIEFVPKDDVQSKRLLVTKKDIFEDYSLENFLNVFSQYFQIKNYQKISDSNRIIYHFEKK